MKLKLNEVIVMKNKSAKSTETHVSDIVSESVSSPTLLNRLTRRKVVLTFVCLVAVAVFLTGVFVYSRAKISQPPKDVVFSINGRDYNHQQVKDLTEFAVKIDQKSYQAAVKDEYSLLKYKSAAEAIGIKYSTQQLQDYRKQQGLIVYKKKNYEDYLNLVAFKNQTQQRLQDETGNNRDGHFSGYSFTFHFDETLTNAPAYKSPHYGDKAMLERDKKYAQDRAKYYHDQLAQKNITADAALAQIRADKQLGYYYVAGTNDSAKFGITQDDDWQKEVTHPEIASFIKQQTKTGLTSTQTGKVAAVPKPVSSRDYIDGYYYFVLLNQVQPRSKGQGQAMQQSLKKVDAHSKYYGDSHV